MSLLGDAFERAGARVQGIVDVTEHALEQGEGGATMDAAALTAAGTDVPGPELAARMGLFTTRMLHGPALSGDELTAADLKAALNGAVMVWFWVGYEARRLQEGGES